MNIGTRSYCLVKNALTFQDASRDCQRMRGHLLVIEDDAENVAVFKKLGSSWGHHGNSLWLGCSDKGREGDWRCLDGNPPRGADWNPGEPNNWGGNENCAEWYADSGGWNDVDCTAERSFLCEGPGSMRCKGRAVELGGRLVCAHADSVNWTTARALCDADGGRLGAPRDADETRRLTEVLALPAGTKEYAIWLGLSDEGQEGSFRWANNAPVRHANWDTGEPNNWGGDENCAEMYLWNGRWNDLGCGNTLPYVCEAD